MSNKDIPVRALQLGERIEVKGLEREDAFSSVPLAFRTGGDGIAVLFKSGAAVFIGMTPVEEEHLIRASAALAPPAGDETSPRQARRGGDSGRACRSSPRTPTGSSS
jgi:hypothetical protein